MITDNEKLHDKLDMLFKQIEEALDDNPAKARDLLAYCLDLMEINRKQLR